MTRSINAPHNCRAFVGIVARREKIMKPIKICEKNEATIEAALREVNGKSEAHTYTRWTELLGVIATAESRALALLGVKKYLPGLIVDAMSGDSVANAYKYQRRTTAVALELRKAGWYLIAAREGLLYPDQRGYIMLSFTAEQDELAVKILRTHYSVRRVAD